MRLCLVLLCLSLFLMPGCSASANRGSGVSEVTPLIGSWVLVSIDGEDVSALLPEGADAPTLTIAENMRLTGMSGVNQYMGEVDDEELTGGTFYTGPLAVTRKAGAAELMQLESRYIEALEGPADARVIDGELVIFVDGEERLRFKADLA